MVEGDCVKSSNVEAVSFRLKSELGNLVPLVEVAGVNLSQYARSVQLRCAAGEVTAANVEVFPEHGFDVELPAAVTVTILALDEGEIEVTTLSDTVKRYRFVRKDAV